MLGQITDVFAQPEAYVCVWIDGELFIRPDCNAPAPASEAAQELAA